MNDTIRLLTDHYVSKCFYAIVEEIIILWPHDQSVLDNHTDCKQSDTIVVVFVHSVGF